MAKCAKLIDKARQSAANLRFDEALAWATCLGFEHVRTNALHHDFERPALMQTVNLQPDKRDPSKAKKRQVEELLKIHDETGFPEER